MAHRKAASVLPEPVGALIRTCSPEAIAGHACAWAAVGASNAPSNQSRTAGLKDDSGPPSAYVGPRPARNRSCAGMLLVARGQRQRALQQRVDHGGGQDTGEGVLLARVKAADQRSVADRGLGAVSEAGLGGAALAE